MQFQPSNPAQVDSAVQKATVRVAEAIQSVLKAQLLIDENHHIPIIAASVVALIHSATEANPGIRPAMLLHLISSALSISNAMTMAETQQALAGLGNFAGLPRA